MTHDAFISYSHAADQTLARELERALEHFAKPWYRRRALDIFRDEGNLNLSSHLQGSLVRALDRSRFVIHLASRAAAASPWVRQELAHWLDETQSRRDRLILVVTDGDLVWNDATGDFDHAASTAISPAMHGVFPGKPFYLDMRWVTAAPESLRDDTRFRTAVVSLVATIRGLPAEDLAGEDAEQHRRTLRVRNVAIGALAVLSAAAIAGAWLATIRAREAAEQREVARREAKTAREALARSSVDAAARHASADQPAATLAHLARAARADPESPATAWIAEIAFNEPLWLPGPPLAHAGSIVAVAVTPDGTRVVTGSVDGTARLWDVATGAALGAPMAHDGPVRAVTFSPDGRHVATTSSDRTARVWDAATGAPVAAPLVHTWRVHSAVFSPDGRRLVTTTHGHAHLWDTATWREATPPLDHGNGESIDAAAFSPDGRVVVTAAADYTVRGWDVATGAAVGQVRHRSDVVDVEFSPDGRHLLTASLDRTAQLWDVSSGAAEGSPLVHTGFVERARFSRDGRFIVTASSDGTARIWETATQRPVGTPLTHAGGVNSARFSADGRLVITASADHLARVWDAATGMPVGRPLEHAEGVNDALLTADGRAITVSSDGTARVWTLAGAPVAATTLVHDDAAWHAEFSRDGTKVAVVAVRRAHVWNVATGQKLAVSAAMPQSPSRAHFSPDGRWLATESRGDVRLWDAATGAPIGEPHLGMHEAAFSPDSRHVLVTSETSAAVHDTAIGKAVVPPSPLPTRLAAATFLADGTAALFSRDARYDWNLTAATVTRTPLRVPATESELGQWRLSPSGQYLITDDGPDVRLRDARTGESLGSSLRHIFAGPRAVFSADERRVATTSSRAARVWAVPTGQPVTLELEHPDGVESVAFSADGRRLVTVCRDGWVRTFDATTGMAAGARLPQPPLSLQAAAFSPDGRRLLTASRDGTVVLRTIAVVTEGGRADELADLAELVGGLRVSALGALEPVPLDDWRASWTRVTGQSGTAAPTRELLLRRVMPQTATASGSAGAR